MRRFFPHPWGWASAAPLLCAAHCALTPLLVVAAPTLAPGETVEFVLYGGTILLASWALAKGLRQHGDLRPVLPIALGLVAWGASLLHVFHPIPEEATTVVAALVVAGGLVWNARLHCAVDAETACGCDTCETEPATARTGARARGETPAPADAVVPTSLPG
jgi:hypothetical protein